MRDRRSTTTPDPRLRLNRGHWILAAVLGLLIVALIANNYAVTAQHRKYSEAFARTETTGNNMFYLVSETLTYINEFNRYLAGASSRRDIQLKRALLAQRLAVVGENGQTAGESTTPEYRAALGQLDEAMQQVPPGILPAEQSERWEKVVLPRSQALLQASRRLADSTTAQLHSDARVSSKNLLDGRTIQLVLLIAALTVGAVLLGWIATDVARQYRAARAALARKREALRSAERQLERVSRLDRGQAEVLERIAVGEALPTVLRHIAELTSGISGRHAARITTGQLSQTVPPEADVSTPPIWSRTFTAGKTDAVGTLEVFGDPTLLDDTDRAAFLRCRDLASLALEQEEARNVEAALAEAKSSYVATVSHEIRAPLHGILGFSELLEGEFAAENRVEAAEWASRVRMEAERLTRLIDDLLNLSRLEAGRTKLFSKAFQLRTMVDDLIQTSRVTAEAKGLRLNASVDPAIADWRIGDPDKLHQVLLNLVSNATKFTRVGRIDVEVSSGATETDPDLIRFAVTDTGPGIPSDDIARILEPFAQVSSSDSHKGSGLGLAISDGLIKAMGGGGLAVVSLEGHGSTFHFTIPLPESAPEEPARRPTGIEPADVGSARTVLVVDDNPTNQLLVAAQLKKLGYLYEAAFDGAEALNRLESHQFDAVLMDCNMPVMDGYVATRRIRAAERGTGVHLPVLALTASTTEANRDACERAGMDGFLTKPLVMADLARELGRLLGGPPAGNPGTAGTVNSSGPGTSEVPILDDQRIDQLLSELGADTLHKVARAFVDEVPRRLGELRQMAAEGDADGVRRCAHSLRSPGAMIGAAALANQLRGIEDSANPVASLSESPLDDVINATVARLQARLGQMVDEGAAP